MGSNEKLWLQTNRAFVEKVIQMVNETHMMGGYGGTLDLPGIVKLLKNLFQKLSEYTTQLDRLERENTQLKVDCLKANKMLETYNKVFEEFSPSNQKVISKIKERVEEECK